MLHLNYASVINMSGTSISGGVCGCRYSVLGTSYGGFVAYRMAEIWPERVEKVVIASSAVNMRRSDNARLLKEADVDKIEDLLLPVTAGQLRSALRFVVSRAWRPYMPDFVLNDFIDVSRFFSARFIFIFIYASKCLLDA